MKKNKITKSICSLILSCVVLVTPFSLVGCSEEAGQTQAGTTWYKGTDNVDNINLGKVGDFYWDTDDNKVYEKKADGTWELVVDNFGAPGVNGSNGQDGANGADGNDGNNGANGATWLSGGENPSATVGNDGDFFLNTTTCDIYQKANGSWNVDSPICNIKGADACVPSIGANGNWFLGDQDTGTKAQGQDGQNGVDGAPGADGADGEDGADGATWLSGIINPESSAGKNGDFYLNVMTFDVFQKVNGSWNVSSPICNIKGEAGDVPSIGANGNWWIGGEDTGVKAVASGQGGGSGSGSTISINQDGYFVIDGVVTEYSANVTSEELYAKLNTVIEYDTAGNFSKTYSSVTDFETGFNNFDTSTFSGWGGCIGKPQSVPAIKFRTKARENAITKMKVWLYTMNGTTKNIVSQSTLDVNIASNTMEDVYWLLDEEYVNENNDALFFAYSCDQYCTGYFSRNTISSDKTDEYVQMSYTYNVTNGNPRDLNTYSSSENANVGYHYMPVEIGEIAPSFKLKESAILKILEDLDLNKNAYQNTQLVLTKNIYGFANQTMQIYFRNICAYNLDEINIRVTTNRTGNKALEKIYTDRWEYKPTGAENFALTIEIYDKNWSLLETSQHNVVIKNTTSKNFVEALVIGDSTVFGGGQGYETATMVSLDNADTSFSIEFLGTMGSGANKYEGRGGWTAGQYLTSQTVGEMTNAFYNPQTSGFDFGYYMTTQGYNNVDVVFLQLGINDIFSSTNESIEISAKNYVNNIKSLVTKIHEYDANIKIVINPIIPCDLDQNKFTEVYGSMQTVWGFLRNMYKANQLTLETFATTSNVYISWYNATIDAQNNQGGDVHPAVAGYTQLGTQMYYMLKAII